MAKKPLPAISILRQLLRYEPDTGRFFWLPRTPDRFRTGKQTSEHNCNIWNGKYAGTEALAADSGRGYRLGQVEGKMVYAHRVAWAMAVGSWPSHEIDHINHDKSDNRLVNLRAVTPAENGLNRPLPRVNTSGHCGVWWHTIGKKWCAEIKVGGRKHYLGLFSDKDEAVAAWQSAAKRLGHHENHGKAAT